MTISLSGSQKLIIFDLQPYREPDKANGHLCIAVSTVFWAKIAATLLNPPEALSLNVFFKL